MENTQSNLHRVIPAGGEDSDDGQWKFESDSDYDDGGVPVKVNLVLMLYNFMLIIEEQFKKNTESRSFYFSFEIFLVDPRSRH